MVRTMYVQGETRQYCRQCYRAVKKKVESLKTGERRAGASTTEEKGCDIMILCSTVQ